ncbi:Arginine exporter protein ArgO OS=Streptomyces albaduncus OX=68172 GN=FHS32_002658 PE=3 SV=1 [Streptomyces griseoloalbus]
MIYFAALVAARQGGGGRGGGAGLFVTAAFAASRELAGPPGRRARLLGRALTGHRGRLVTALVASGVMTALALRMALTPG